MIEFACPHCGRISELEERLLGQRAACPGCQQRIFVLPSLGAQPARERAGLQGETDVMGLRASDHPFWDVPFLPAAVSVTLAACAVGMGTLLVVELPHVVRGLILLGLVAGAFFLGLASIILLQNSNGQ